MNSALHEWLPHWTRRDPRALFAIVDECAVTREEALGRVERMASALLRAGVAPGERIVAIARNGLELPLLAVAASRVGAVLAPLNPRLAPPEWRFLIDDSEAAVVVVDEQLVPAASEAVDGLARVRTRVRIAADATEASAGAGQPTTASDAPSRADADWVALEEWAGSAEPLPSVNGRGTRGAGRDALQLTTSGTTGRPKGVVLSQSALFHALDHWRQLYPVRDGDHELLTMPMHHSGGLFFALHAMMVGASVRILREFDPRHLLDCLAQEAVVRVSLVPTMIDRCLEIAAAGRIRAPRALRILTYGGSPISVASLESALGFFDCDLSQAYGMTELPSLSYLRVDDHRRALRGEPELLETVGTAAPECEVQIVEARDPEAPSSSAPDLAPPRVLETGVVGEICGRGPQQMERYWKRPEESARTLRDGWVHTGDAGFIDQRGYLHIVDRIKDVIVTGGENVASREVEDVLGAHPEVHEVAVIATPSERWGEAVTAVIVPVAGAAPTPASLEAFCRERIAAFKRPRRFESVEALPRNASGKVLKRELRERFR